MITVNVNVNLDAIPPVTSDSRGSACTVRTTHTPQGKQAGIFTADGGAHEGMRPHECIDPRMGPLRLRPGPSP